MTAEPVDLTAAATAIAPPAGQGPAEKFIPKIGEVFTIICNNDSICKQEEFGNFKWRRVEYKLLEGETYPRLPTMLSAVLVDGQDISLHPHEEERLAWSEGKEDWCVHEGKISAISEARYDYWPAEGKPLSQLLEEAFWWAGTREAHGYWFRVWKELPGCRDDYMADRDDGEAKEDASRLTPSCLVKIKQLIAELSPFAETQDNPILLDAVVVLRRYLAKNGGADSEQPSR